MSSLSLFRASFDVPIPARDRKIARIVAVFATCSLSVGLLTGALALLHAGAESLGDLSNARPESFGIVSGQVPLPVAAPRPGARPEPRLAARETTGSAPSAEERLEDRAAVVPAKTATTGRPRQDVTVRRSRSEQRRLRNEARALARDRETIGRASSSDATNRPDIVIRRGALNDDLFRITR
jgi:hypothetical protein